MAKEEKKYIFSEWGTNMEYQQTGLPWRIRIAENETKGKYLRTECIPQGKGEKNLYIMFCEVEVPASTEDRKQKIDRAVRNNAIAVLLVLAMCLVLSFPVWLTVLFLLLSVCFAIADVSHTTNLLTKK